MKHPQDDWHGMAASRQAARRRLLQLAGVAAWPGVPAWLTPAAVHAQAQAQSPAAAWPVKAVRLIVTSAAGSPWDPIARHLADRFGKAFGQPFFVENRSGGTGLIGMDQLAKSSDGHSLAIMFMPHTVLPALVPKMPYDTLKDIVPIGQTQWSYNVLVVRSSLPVNNMAELVALVKTSPGKLVYSSGGSGSPAHLMGEYFKQLTGSFILHVPYRGPVGALQDLVGGQVDLMFASLASALPHIRSGRLRALALTATERLEVLPEVPTFGQAGFPQFDVRDWAGLVGPASLPPAAVERIHTELVKALTEPGIAQRFAQMGIYLHSSTPAAFADLVRREIPKWGEVVRKSGIRME